MSIPWPQSPYRLYQRTRVDGGFNFGHKCWLWDAEDAEGVRWSFVASVSREEDEKRFAQGPVIDNDDLAFHCVAIWWGWGWLDADEKRDYATEPPAGSGWICYFDSAEHRLELWGPEECDGLL